ncbi:hypothetical protein GCM10027073_52600 [Streptomyces chlorus]
MSQWFVAYNLHGGDPVDPSSVDGKNKYDRVLDAQERTPRKMRKRARAARGKSGADADRRRQEELRRNGLL